MISPEQWAASGSYLTWRGQNIFVRRTGAGEPLLLIHGFPTASWDWHKLMPALEARYQVICFDLLGFGLSDKPTSFDYSIAAQADLAEAVLQHFAVRHCRILAHDYGDTIAQELLARQHDGSCAWQLQQLMLLNGGLFPETHRPLLLQRLLASPLGGFIARLTRYSRFAATMNRICRHSLAEPELLAMWQLLTRAQGLQVMPKLIGYMAERKRQRERWVGALIATSIPVRLIIGMADPISGAHMVARYRQLIPKPDIVELAGVGHYPQLEASDRLLDALGA